MFVSQDVLLVFAVSVDVAKKKKKKIMRRNAIKPCQLLYCSAGGVLRKNSQRSIASSDVNAKGN